LIISSILSKLSGFDNFDNIDDIIWFDKIKMDDMNDMNSREFVSLGGSCAVAYHLRQHVKEFKRLPFDWVKMTIQQLNEVLASDFDERFSSLSVKKFSQVHPLIQDDNGKVDQKKESIKEESGSLILVNLFKMQFAHQILEIGCLETFIPQLKERIIRFHELGRVVNDKTLTFVRLETGRIGKNYLVDLRGLINNLATFFGTYSFHLILIIHIDALPWFENHDFKDVNLILHTFSEFDSDWKYPKIDWKSVFNH
jgi:hypothetical protein